MKIGLATYMDKPMLPKGEELLLEGLRQAGHFAAPLPWNAQTLPDFDVVIIRSCWDYHYHAEAFFAWLNKLDRGGIRLFNDLETLLKNGDKAYLVQLQEKGFPTVPTRLLKTGEIPDTDWYSHPNNMWIAKPTVSANAKGLRKLTDSQDKWWQQPVEEDLLLQPYLPEVAAHGEWSLIYFNGNYSHAVRKMPAPDDFRVQAKYGGTHQPGTPDASMISLGQEILASLPALCLYARVDLVEVAGKPMLMELELIEPELFLEAAENASRFLAAILERL